jgi:pimeloyl-ACP methyl ester carboxylesterase
MSTPEQRRGPAGRLALVLLLPGLSACGPGREEPGPYDFSGITLAWRACALHEGGPGLDAECAAASLPRHWSAPGDGQRFLVGAKRRLGTRATAQLWLLHGGPGASGVLGLPPLMESLQADAPWLDVYTLDPRGAGVSEYLGCPEQEAPESPGGSAITEGEYDACIQHLVASHGQDLSLFGATAAAIDLAALMHATREPGKPAFVWGGSAGTFWAQRFLQIFPRGADGVILEGVLPADQSMVFQDEHVEKTGREVLARCRADAACAARLPDPEGSLQTLVGLLEGGHCAALGLDAGALKNVLWQILYYRPHLGTLPALVFRLTRCSAADRQAVAHYLEALFRPAPDRSMSTALHFNQMFSELWEQARFTDNAALRAYLDEVHADAYLALDAGHMRNELFLRWPRYHDPLDDGWAESSVPLLMLQGELDPATPYELARAMTARFTAAHQTLVSFPNVPHNAISGSALSTFPGATTCGQRLWLAFMQAPEAPLDAGCAARVLPIDLEGRIYGGYFFGTTDYWSESAVRRAPEPLPPALRTAAAELAARLRQALPALARRVDAGL